MNSGYEIEQVFLENKGGNFSFLVVSIAPSGKVRKETLVFSRAMFTNPHAATKKLACRLAERGDIDSAAKTRFRRRTPQTMQDDAELKKLFISVFDDCLEAIAYD